MDRHRAADEALIAAVEGGECLSGFAGNPGPPIPHACKHVQARSTVHPAERSCGSLNLKVGGYPDKIRPTRHVKAGRVITWVFIQQVLHAGVQG